MHRVGKPNGYALSLNAGENHLIELKQKIYEDIKPHESHKAVDAIGPQWTLEKQDRLEFKIDIQCQETVAALLGMTPHFWRASPAKKETLLQLDQLSLSVDIESNLFKRNDGSS